MVIREKRKMVFIEDNVTGVYLRLALVAAEAPKVRWPRELEVEGRQ